MISLATAISRSRTTFFVACLIVCLGAETRPVRAQDVTKDGRFNAVAWTQNSAEYRLAARQAYRLAALQLERGLARADWSADETQNAQADFAQKSPAVILDVDETVLDNSPFNARGIIESQPFSRAAWDAWVMEEKATPIPGAIEFIRFARSKNVAVFYVTNRTDNLKPATISNLRKLGLPAGDQWVLTRNDDAGRGGDKATRRAHVAKKHRIVLLIGDNLGDLCSEMRQATNERRNQIARRKEKLLGERWILLPNPTYGGWEFPYRSNPLLALRTERDAAPVESIGVGSFNIEHLGNASSRYGNAGGKAQKPGDLAAKILETKCDVLALQEIYITASGRRNKTLNQVMEILNSRPGSRWTYELFRNRFRADDSQVTGVAWNQKRVSRVGSPFRIPIKDDTEEFYEWDRHPHAVKFSAGANRSDFVIIPLHMKAGKNEKAARQRESEARMLVAQLKSVRDHFGDKDVILIGDTNITSAEERTADIFIAARYRDLLPPNQSTVTFGPRAFDRIFAPLNAGAEVAASRQIILRPPASERDSYRLKYSDHFPISMRVRVGKDDD